MISFPSIVKHLLSKHIVDVRLIRISRPRSIGHILALIIFLEAIMTLETIIKRESSLSWLATNSLCTHQIPYSSLLTPHCNTALWILLELTLIERSHPYCYFDAHF